MTAKQAVRDIQEKFGVNAIYAQTVYSLADKSDLEVDVARIIDEKPKPFVKWVGGKRQLLKQFR